MAKKPDPSSDSDPEEVPKQFPENSSSQEDDSDRDGDYCNEPQKKKQNGAILSEYEKQRLSRIAENRARMEALGLPKIAASFKSNTSKSHRNSSDRKGKRKVADDDDEDYRPNDDDNDDDDPEDVDDDDDEDFVCNETARSRKQKVNKKSPKPRKKAAVQRQLSSSDFIDGDDEELMQAIALSLQDSAELLGGAPKKEGNARAPEDTGSRRRKKSFASRVQMTEDEVILHFFQFDGAGKGSISVRDIERVSVTHDFVWTDKELADMIHCFDSDRDGKLTLGDFRKIVGRCNMIKGSDDS